MYVVFTLHIFYILTYVQVSFYTGQVIKIDHRFGEPYCTNVAEIMHACMHAKPLVNSWVDGRKYYMDFLNYKYSSFLLFHIVRPNNLTCIALQDRSKQHQYIKRGII